MSNNYVFIPGLKVIKETDKAILFGLPITTIKKRDGGTYSYVSKWISKKYFGVYFRKSVPVYVISQWIYEQLEKNWFEGTPYNSEKYALKLFKLPYIWKNVISYDSYKRLIENKQKALSEALSKLEKLFNTKWNDIIKTITINEDEDDYTVYSFNIVFINNQKAILRKTDLPWAVEIKGKIAYIDSIEFKSFVYALLGILDDKIKELIFKYDSRAHYSDHPGLTSKMDDIYKELTFMLNYLEKIYKSKADELRKLLQSK